MSLMCEYIKKISTLFADSVLFVFVYILVYSINVNCIDVNCYRRTVEFLQLCSLYFFLMCRVTYSKDTLLSLRKSVNNNFVTRPFTPTQWTELRQLNITKTTKRGCRGGKRLHRIIHLRVTNRILTRQFFKPKCVTKNNTNLIHIKKSNSCSPSAKFALWNAQSMRGRAKASAIIDFVISRQLDIFAITESWLTGDERDNRVLSDLRNSLPNYVLYHVPRKKRGGGVAVLLRKGFDVAINKPLSFTSFEYIDMMISSGPSSVRLLTIYRPPPSKANKTTVKAFFDEFSILVEMFTSLQVPIVFAGDFNFHMDVCDDRDARVMRDLLDCASLDQHVNKSTHRRGHTLDLIITRMSDSITSNIDIDTSLASDHAVILCTIAISRPPAIKHRFSFRKSGDIDIDAFKRDITASSLVSDPAGDVETLSTQFDMVMTELLNLHAPKVSRCVTLRPHAPWYDDSIRADKRERRRCERQFLKSGLEVHKKMYIEMCKNYSNKIESAKADYHVSQFKDCDQKQLFKAVDKMCSANSKKTLPSHDNTEKLDFFKGKIRQGQG